MLLFDIQIIMYIEVMLSTNEHINILLMRYRAIMEEAYNLRQTDPALSDYDFFEGLRIRKDLEFLYNIDLKTSTNTFVD